MFGGMGQGMNGLCLSFDGLDRLGFLVCVGVWVAVGSWLGGILVVCVGASVFWWRTLWSVAPWILGSPSMERTAGEAARKIQQWD